MKPLVGKRGYLTFSQAVLRRKVAAAKEELIRVTTAGIEPAIS
jgi:hypothetical protein